MKTLLDLCAGMTERSCNPGEVLLEEGTRTGLLYILIEGGVDVLKEGFVVGSINVEGSVFGEISFLLNTPHTATVRTNTKSRFYVTSNVEELFNDHPLAYYHISVNLASRIRSLNDYFVAFKNELDKDERSAEVMALVDVVLHRTA